MSEQREVQLPVVFDAVPPKNYPRVKGTPVEAYPTQGSTTTPFFPPVCLKSHWDATQIYQKTVPSQHVALPIDFRPWTKVCMEYVTAGPVEALPPVPDSVVFPSGGEFYPPQRWSNNIDNDSLARRLDRPLGTCEDNQYIPPRTGDMFQQRVLIPARQAPSTQFIEELAMPKALLRSAPYDCREQADRVSLNYSDRLFNNATKQDRYHKFGRAESVSWKQVQQKGW